MVALVAGLVALSAAIALALALAGTAFDGADRGVEDRRVATSLSERLVSAESPLTARANVLDADAVESFAAADLDSAFPVAENRSVRIRLDDRTLVEQGDPTDGATVRRVVLVQREETITTDPSLTASNDYATTLPRRTSRIELSIDPPDGTRVTTVRANDRIVLRNQSGLDGPFEVSVSRFETVRLSFDVEGSLQQGNVTLTYYPAETKKAVLEVTVDDEQ
ncbi:hypothetical protein BRC81_11860 [Halobacteriales archaeon QS_1_68_20]|nr:MAG: hypothetical protein BRC81_11860 [Halobacteriales archaeon QS_1_68_20]